MLKRGKNKISYFIAALAVIVSMTFGSVVPAAASENVAQDDGYAEDGAIEVYSAAYDDSGEAEGALAADEAEGDVTLSGEDGSAAFLSEDGSGEGDGEILNGTENPDDPDEDEVLGIIANDDPIETQIEEEVEAEEASTLLYLSDLDPVYQSIGWGEFMRDENPENGQISLRVNGAVTGFKKGVAAHAESTLIYDVHSLYEQGYRYFQTYYGVNSTKAGSVKFYMYTTTDADYNAAAWTEVEGVDSSVKSGSSAAGYIEIPLTEDMTYLKLYADPDGGNGQDHAVYGGAKFITDSYYHDDVLTVAEYDERIREYYAQYGTDLWSDPEYEQLLLERDLVDKVGYETLQGFFNEEDGESYKEMIEWLFDNPSFLKMYLTGDAPGGNYLAGTYSYSGSSYDSYSDSLQTMFKLWQTHREDFDNTGSNGLYQKMIAAVSLSLTGSVKFWYGTTGGTADSSVIYPDPVERYEIYKDMYAGGTLLTGYFDQLYVPEMRYIMGSPIHNNEILWGANLAKERNYNTNCYSWMYYQYGTFNYFQDKFYNDETWGSDPTYDYVNKYYLNEYGITNYGYGDTTTVKYPMNWIGMVDGGTCWPIANLCQNIWSSYGRPCYICGCWGGTHEVYMAYNWYEGSDNSGRSGYGRWTVENGLGVAWQDVNYGAYDSTGWHIARLICGWGTNSDSRYTNASYVILGQSAMNDYNNYVKAEELEMLSRVYADEEETLESIYWAMLDIEGFHYDAWRGLVKLYAASSVKSDEDKYNLAEQMMAKSALYYYPIPLDDLLSLLKNSMSSQTYITMVQNSEQETLRAASQTTDDEFYSAYAVQQVAKGLLGTGDSVVGSFSFDGENAGKIILDQEKFPHPEYWEYSLDGGNTWSEVIHDAEVEDAGGVEEIEGITTYSQAVVENTNAVQLTNEEIAQINTEDNILIRFIQVPDYWYTIYINESAKPVKGSIYDVVGVYLNPWENKAIYTTDSMEWRNAGDESASWVSFADAQPDRNANTEIDVRYRANGTNMAGESITLSYESSDNNYKEEEGYYYVPISRLTLYDYTAQANDNRAIKYALDGTIYSFYQSVTTTDYPIYITLQLDEPAYLNKLEYQCNLGNTANGQVRKARVLVSMDGEEWTEVEYLEGTDGYANYSSGASEYLEWGGGNSASGKAPKQVYFTPVQAQYIRFEAYDCTANFMSVGDLRVYANTELIDVEDEEEASEPDNEEAGITDDEETGGSDNKGTDEQDNEGTGALDDEKVGTSDDGTTGATENVETDTSESGTTGNSEDETVGDTNDQDNGDSGNQKTQETESGNDTEDKKADDAYSGGLSGDDITSGTTSGNNEGSIGGESTETSDNHTVQSADGSAEITYDIIYEDTDDGIRVTIETDKQLKELDGWDLSDDGTSLTRLYTSGAEDEEIIVYDTDGNEYGIPIAFGEVAEIEIYDLEEYANYEEAKELASQANLDVSYEVVGDEVLTTITDDRAKLQEKEGWDRSDDGMSLRKMYSADAGHEEVTVIDAYGNTFTVAINPSEAVVVKGEITDPDGSNPSDTESAKTAKTGDSNIPVVLLYIMMFCAAAVIAFVVVWRMRRRKH